MAIIYTDRKGGYAAIHFTANGTQTLSGLASNETMLGARVSKVYWGANTDGTWQVSRGANTVMVLTGTGHIDFQEDGVIVEKGGEDEQDITVSLSTASEGFIMMKLNKESDYDSEY